MKDKKRYIQNLVNDKEDFAYPQDKLFECREQIKIKSCFFMKHLMKITSKKCNQNIISFYFKIPDFSIKFKLENSSLFEIIKKLNIRSLSQLITNESNNFLLNLNQDIETVIDNNKKLLIFIVFF